MSRAILLSMNGWTNEIFSGKKLDEFRGYNVCNFKKDMKIYFLQKGFVEGEAVVEKLQVIWSTADHNTMCLKDVEFINAPVKGSDYVQRKDLQKIGYSHQHYAIKLKDVKKYDKPIPKEEFMLWNTLQKFLEKTIDINDKEQVDITIKYAKQKHMFDIKRSPQSFCYVVERS